MIDVRLDEVQAFCQQFKEGQAYRNPCEKYLAWLLEQYEQFRDILDGRDATIIRLIEEKSNIRRDLNKQIKELQDELDAKTKRR